MSEIENDDIKVGDRVSFRNYHSTCPDMIVSGVTERDGKPCAMCWWFTESLDINAAHIPTVILERVD